MKNESLLALEAVPVISVMSVTELRADTVLTKHNFFFLKEVGSRVVVLRRHHDDRLQITDSFHPKVHHDDISQI